MCKPINSTETWPEIHPEFNFPSNIPHLDKTWILANSLFVVHNDWQLPVRIRVFLLCHIHTQKFTIYMYICCLLGGYTAMRDWMTVNEILWVGNETETCGLKLIDVWKNPVKPCISLVCVFVVPTGIRTRHVPNTDGKRYDLMQYFRFLLLGNNYRECKI